MTPFLPMTFLSKNNFDPLELSIFCTYDDIWKWIDDFLEKNPDITKINSNTFKFTSVNDLEKFSTIFTLKWSSRLTTKNKNFIL